MVASNTLTADATTEPGGARSASLWDRVPVAWLPVGAIVAWQGWYLHAELNPGHYPNDSSFHLAYLRWAADRVGTGDSPLDGIFPNLGLGFPIFEHYQVLPHLLTAPFAWLFGAQHTYVAVLYLLLALWPVCVYASVRLLEFDRTSAAAAAVLAPFVTSVPGYGFELGSYVWRGYGMWTQAWGMWLFAFTIACTWRAVFRGRSLALAAVLFAALLTSHLLTGFLAAVVVLLWPLLGPSPRWPKVRRSLAVVAAGGVASAWLLLPSYLDHRATFFENPADTAWRDSYGAGQVTSWLVRGELFDAHRHPVITVLAAVGLVVLVTRRRRRDNARAVVGLFTVSLVLFFGTGVVGPIVDRLPAREVLFLHRMIVGVHFGGVVLAGVGAAALIRAALGRLTRVPVRNEMRIAIVAAACVLLLAPAWTQIRASLQQNSDWIAQQRHAEATDGRDFAALVGIAAAQGGRVYAGSRDGGWGPTYRIGFIPGYIELLDLGVEAVGFSGRVPTLTEPAEAIFDPESAAQAEVFDVRWQIRPATLPGPPGSTLVASRGRHRLWSVPTSGRLRLGDTTTAIATDREDVVAASVGFLGSTSALKGRYPLLALDGDALADTPTASADGSTPEPAGGLTNVTADADGGAYSATVDTNRPAAVIVKTSTHPRWSARVDGRATSTAVVAPGLVAVEVPAGQHELSLRYAGFPIAARLAIVAAGAAAIAALVFVDRSKRRSRPARAAVRTPIRSSWWSRASWSSIRPLIPAGRHSTRRPGTRASDRD